jgi:murein L,D-transpeptidase YafK
MVGFRSARQRPGGIGRILALVAVLLVAAGGWSTSAMAKVRHVAAKHRAVAPAHQPTASVAAQKPDPEYLLINIYKSLAAGHLSEAQAKADALVEAYPNFRLGNLIRGDLLLMHTQPVRTFGAVAAPDNAKLENLREEAMVRLKSLRERPDPDLVPRAVLQLRDDQRHVLVVDTERARLYVYENYDGQLKLVTDYYISHGRLGTHKMKAGDQKTPLGVYYITSRVPGVKLPDFYGTGALPINYPNDWDKLNGRSGSGIWLHGTPSDSYSRPPLSSDGCVVLTNPDINKLYGEVEVGKTPVVISDNVEFVSKTKWLAERNSADRLLESWRKDFETMDMVRLGEHYSAQFKSERGEELASWMAKQRQIFSGARHLTLRLGELSMFRYPGQDDMMVATFTQEASADRFRNVMRKRQYWKREGAQWKIVSEANF